MNFAFRFASSLKLQCPELTSCRDGLQEEVSGLQREVQGRDQLLQAAEQKMADELATFKSVSCYLKVTL